MSARLYVTIAAAVLLCGCSSVEMVKTGDGTSAFRDVNRAVKGKVVRMQLIDGQAMHITGVHVASDSVTWINQKNNRLEAVSTQYVHQLSIHKTGKGALRGLLFGAFVGAAAGGVRASMEGDDPASDPLAITREEKLRIYPAAHALYASLATTPIGAMIGTRKVFRFDTAPLPAAVSKR